MLLRLLGFDNNYWSTKIVLPSNMLSENSLVGGGKCSLVGVTVVDGVVVRYFVLVLFYTYVGNAV